MKTLRESLLDADFDISDVDNDSAVLINFLNSHIVSCVWKKKQLAGTYEDIYNLNLDVRELNQLIRRTFKKIPADKLSEIKPKCFIKITKGNMAKSRISVVSRDYNAEIFSDIIKIYYDNFNFEQDIYNLPENPSKWYTIWVAPDELARDIYRYVRL